MRLLLIISLIFAASCSNSPTTDARTATTFNYVLTPDAGPKNPLKRVVIATVNYSDRSPRHLRKREQRVDSLMIDYLTSNGFEVLTGNQFETLWSRGLDTHGEYYDPYSARFRRDRFDAILADSLKALKEKYGVDAVIFTDLISRSVAFADRPPHFAVWDGVKRRPLIKGSKKLPRKFKWSTPFDAASLSIIIFRADNKFLFNSVGGIEVTDYLDLRSKSPKVKHNKTLFQSQESIMEGIALAFHPFIKMHNYPGSN